VHYLRIVLKIAAARGFSMEPGPAANDENGA
jgi:hypothetical protein